MTQPRIVHAIPADFEASLGLDALATSLAASTAAPGSANVTSSRVQNMAHLRAMRAWWSALANRENAPANVVIISDSKPTMGAANWSDTLAGTFGRRLRAKYPVAGAPGPASGLNFIPAYTESTTLPGPFTYGGSGLSKNTLFGLGRNCAQMNGTFGPATSNAATGLFTGLTSCKLCAHRSSQGGNIGLAINAGAVVNLNTAGAGGEVTGVSTPLTGGTDSLVISYVSGTLNQFEGAYVYNGDEAKGFGVYHSGHFGWNTQNWTDGAAAGDGLGLQWVLPRLAELQPALVIIELGTNDPLPNGSQVATVAPQQTATNLSSMVAQINATINTSIGIVADTQRAASGIASNTSWSQYLGAAYSVASQYANADVCNLNNPMPSVANDITGLYSDNVHWSKRGHSTAADVLLEWVSPHA